MPEQKQQKHEPTGFTPRTSGFASEYAREQGGDINEEQRAQTPREKQKYDGGHDFYYDAQDFGDKREDASEANPKPSNQPAKK